MPSSLALRKAPARPPGRVTFPAGNLDAAVEEGIGWSLFSQARIRLTMERAFAGRAPRLFPLVVGSAIVQIVVSLTVFVYIQVYFQTYFDERIDIAERVYYTDFVTMNYYLATVCWIYYWGTDIDIIDYSGVMTPIVQTEVLIPGNISFWDERALYFQSPIAGFLPEADSQHRGDGAE